ncbi:unnamed protein product [Allacma fusca]|uniref:Oligopeptide transporter 1 n=1 Tax=Allacma fusca TaxID=39272 RepID=A0A8J2JDP1_9HEXA|nr:unnamed protein product [Allacma fusca]
MSSEDPNPDGTSQTESGLDVESTAKKIPYPKSVFLILANEFCERFSYYGNRAILTLYLKNVLLFEEHTATTIYHATAMLAYFTPLFGAMLADSILGKFRTILYLSIVYALGNIVVSLAATPPVNLPAVPFTLLGLILIGLGTGGIKPCVSSFGGDQFVVPEQEKQLASFFFIFYFSINAGSLISTFVTPIFRKDVSCFGDTTCYSLAFSVPAALMIISLIIFIIGKSFYKIKRPTGNVVISVVRIIKHALSRRKISKESKEHWLDHAADKYSRREIEDIKIVLRILFLYIPLPFFWALFDQQGSTWTFQASRMKGNIGNYVFLPDQMQVINPALVLILIPIFDRIVYPLLGKCGLFKKPLQRLTLGGVFAGIAFIISGVVELELQKTYPVELAVGESNLNIINMAPFNISGKFDEEPENFVPDIFSIPAGDSYNFGVLPNGTYDIVFNGLGGDVSKRFILKNQKASTLLITAKQNNELEFTFPGDTVSNSLIDSGDMVEKSSDGNPYVRVIQANLWSNHLTLPVGPKQNETLTRNQKLSINLDEVKKSKYKFQFAYEPDFDIYSDWRSTPAQEVDVAEYNVIIGEGPEQIILDGTISVELGGSYVLTITNSTDPTGYAFQLSTLVEPNSMHMFWLFPQYIIMTMGEIMFSITIMDFSYSQAPTSMKSVMQSAWLMTVAFGNLIVVIIAEARFFDKQWKEFFLFAGLMFLDMIIFSYMAHCYKPAQLEDTEEEKPAVIKEGSNVEKDK